MESLIKAMMSIFLVLMVVAAIVFFSLFGILPAGEVVSVLKGDPQPSGTSTIIYSTTTVVERIVERERAPDNESDNTLQNTDQQDDQQQPNDTSDQQTESDTQTQTEPDSEQQENTTTTQELPPAVFNTSGEITSIESSILFVDSDGSHMETIPASGVVEVEVTVTDSTNIFDSGNNEISISDLNVGDNISIEASGNIKNETEFEGSNINVSN